MVVSRRRFQIGKQNGLLITVALVVAVSLVVGVQAYTDAAFKVSSVKRPPAERLLMVESIRQAVQQDRRFQARAVAGADEAEALNYRLAHSRELIADGRYAAAQRLLGTLLRRYPDHLRVLTAWALLQWQLPGDIEDGPEAQSAAARRTALIRLLQALAEPKAVVDAIVEAYLDLSDKPAARSILAELEQYGEFVDVARLWGARLDLAAGDLRAARRQLATVVASSAMMTAESAALRARIFLAFGDAEQAVAAYYAARDAYAAEIKLRMRQGRDVERMASAIQRLQLAMVRGLMASTAYEQAETILLNLAEKMPADPEVMRLLERIRFDKLTINAG
jgi:hypothetical protein